MDRLVLAAAESSAVEGVALTGSVGIAATEGAFKVSWRPATHLPCVFWMVGASFLSCVGIAAT